MVRKGKSWLKRNLSPATKLWLKRWAVKTKADKSKLRDEVVEHWGRVAKTQTASAKEFNHSVKPWDPQYSPPVKQSIRASDVQPHVSIVIPVFNKADFTFHCLRALVEEIALNESEIIVVNNASTDHTSKVLSSFGELIKVIQNESNLGFVEACNRGAAEARGKYLVFLNNDTLVLSNWLETLVDTAEETPETGAVGSMFIYPDGRIQEAGGIVWNSGDAFHYGWGKPADEAIYNFAREVDYCSAASLLVRKDLFDRLGGFDRRYAPAYYEDVDLCFGIRSLGFKVIYQPCSRVVHFEGVTSGTDTNTGFKRYQLINHEKFRQKWADVLKRDHVEQGAVPLDTAANRKQGLRILVCDDRVPAPDRDAGGARMFLILKSLLKLGQPLFISFSDFQRPDDEQALRKLGVETAAWTDYKALLKKRDIDVALLSRPDVAAALLMPIKRASRKTRTIFDTVDLSFIRLGREHELNGDSKIDEAAKRYRKLETQLARDSHQVWCVTTEDVAALSALAPEAKFEIVPTIHPLQERGKDFASRQGIVFIGNYLHSPNLDAMHYFVREIFPLVKKECVGVKLFIVGDHAPPEIEAYASDDVIVTGYVADVDEIFQSARVFIAPLRFGSGIKGKIGQALSYGLPVVTTSIGAEGMGLGKGRAAMIADDPTKFAIAVTRVYQDPDLWQQLSDNGYEHVRTTFTPAVVEESIHRAVLKLVESNRGRKQDE